MRKKQSTPTEDLLRVEGVNAKGYGTIPRFAMIDSDLSCWGKLLYAYLCSLAGSGNQTWPKRETILTHLGISKTTYYIAQKDLLEQGYIKTEKTRAGNRQGANIFTLASSLPKAKKLPSEGKSKSDQAITNRVIAHGLKAGGYGMIPRLVMQDGRICAKTKLVYAYFASYAGAGCSSFPAVSVALFHLQLYRSAWQKAIRELSKCGYLVVEQRRVKGRFDVCDYHLMDKPVPKPQKPQKEEAEILPKVAFKDSETSPRVGKWDTEKLPEAEFWDTENRPEAGLWDTENRPEAGLWDTEKPPEIGFEDTEILPKVGKWDTEKLPEAGLWDAVKWDTEGQDTYLINLSTDLSNNLSINQSIYPEETAAVDVSQDGLMDRMDGREKIRRQVKEQLQMGLARAAQSGTSLSGDKLLDLLVDALFNVGEIQTLPTQSVQSVRPVEKQSKPSREEEFAECRATVRDRVDYYWLCDKRVESADQIDEMVELMVETLCSKRKTIRIAGEDLPARKVKNRFRELDRDHVLYVLDSINDTTREIRNIRQYLLTALFNAPSTIYNYLATR